MQNGTQSDAWIWAICVVVPLLLIFFARLRQAPVNPLPVASTCRNQGCFLIFMLMMFVMLVVVFGDSNLNP